MFRYAPPEVLLFTLIVAGILSLIPARRRRQKSVASSSHSSNDNADIITTMQRMNTMQRIVNEHSDCTAEVFNLVVTDWDNVRVIRRLSVGARINLRLVDDSVMVCVGSKEVDEIFPPEGSRLPHVLSDHIPFDAYLGGHNDLESTPDVDFSSIIVFYKLNGVPPTKVNLE